MNKYICLYVHKSRGRRGGWGKGIYICVNIERSGRRSVYKYVSMDWGEGMGGGGGGTVIYMYVYLFVRGGGWKGGGNIYIYDNIETSGGRSIYIYVSMDGRVGGG